MRTVLRENALCGVAAACGCAALAWLGLIGFAWNDYEVEALPAVNALVRGHLLEFLRLAPAYGGSLVERAPFALAPGLWGGGELAVYRTLALPCLLAAALLGIYLVDRMRAHGSSRLARGVALAVCVANPVALRALELGHAEELLDAALCVTAVLLAATPAASRGRALLAGVALGLAIADKESALLAVGPMLAALPARRRMLGLGSMLASAGAVLGPLLLVPGGGFLAGTRAIASTPSTIFQPWQFWWFFGHHGKLVFGDFHSPKPGYRTGPAWAATISHPLVVALGAVLAVCLLVRALRSERRGAGPLPASQALLALALVMLLRCLFDTWDVAYYGLPFLFALLAWEVRWRPSAPPLLALACTVLVWLAYPKLPLGASPDVEAAFFLAWTLPLSAWLGIKLLRERAPTPSPSLRVLSPEGPQEITVRVLGKPVTTS